MNCLWCGKHCNRKPFLLVRDKNGINYFSWFMGEKGEVPTHTIHKKCEEEAEAE